MNKLGEELAMEMRCCMTVTVNGKVKVKVICVSQ
jgi:hypothetical protein